MLSDPFNPFGPAGTFAPRRIGTGGARPRRKSEEAPPAEAAYEEDRAPAEARPTQAEVVLSDLRFGQETAGFGESVKVSVKAVLPESLSHLTRIEFTLLEKGEPVAKAEGHLREGKAEASFTLPEADGKAKERDFTGRARHKHSKAIDGGTVKAQGDAPADLEVEIEDGLEAKREGHGFRLKGGKADILRQAKDGVEKGGKLLLRFEKLDPSSRYTLEWLDSKGRKQGVIFSDRRFGDWSP